MKPLRILTALFAVFIFSMGVSMAAEIDPIKSFIGCLTLSFVPAGTTGAIFAGLNKEIWLSDLLEGFYADDMFITECRDMSAFVENDKINLAEAGVNPDVLINNNSYPISVSERPDGAIALELDVYDTENQRLRHADKAELSYDKLTSINYGHKQALKMAFLERAAHAIAPASDDVFTPLLETSGAANDDGNKRITFKDILKLSRRFNDAEIPAQGRILVLSSEHEEELMAEDIDKYNRIIIGKGEIFGFKIYRLAQKRLPRYNKSTGAKVAYGAAATPATDVHASIAFHKDEVMRAKGTADLFHQKAEDNPQERADVLGYQMRGLTLPIRGKAVAAIYAPVSA